MTGPLRRTAAVLLLASVAAGCGGSGSQGSPAGTIENFYQHIEQGEFDKACDLILPEVRDQYAQLGRPCQNLLADNYDKDKRAGFADVRIDSDQVEVDGDTATVPEDAVTFSGTPSTDDGTELVKQAGQWFVSGNSNASGSGD